MDKMTMIEAADYVAAMDADGITLTDAGMGAAKLILEKRAGWTPSHCLMLSRLDEGQAKLPHKLARLVARTRLGDALELMRKANRKHIRNQKARARRKASRARRTAYGDAVNRDFMATFGKYLRGEAVDTFGERVNSIEASAS